MATRDNKKPARRPAKKKPAKKATNSKVEEARRAAVERRLERDTLHQKATAERTRLQQEARKKGEIRPPEKGVDSSQAYSVASGEKPPENPREGINHSLSDAANKITGLATPLIKSAQAKAALERKPLSNPELYGASTKTRAAKLAEIMNAQTEQAMAQVKKAGNAVFMGQKKGKIRVAGPQRMDPEGLPGGDTVTETVGDEILTKQELLSWLSDETKVAQIKDVANKAGINVETYDDIAKLWGSVVDMAASSYSLAKKKVTPWSIIQLRGKYMGPDGRPKSRVTTSTSIDEMSPEEARLMFERAAMDQLGRQPTKAEIDDFIAKAQTIARQNPAVTTTTSQMGFDGNVVSQTSRTVGGSDEVAAKSQLAALDQARQSEDYAAYQAAGNYFPMLFEALQAPT